MAKEGWRPEVWKAFAEELGILGAPFPEDLGGLGGGAVETLIIMEEFGKALVALLDWKLPMPQAVALPNLIAHGDVSTPEPELGANIVAGLQARGLVLARPRSEESGLHGVQRTATGLLGGADPRREGIAEGF